MLISLFMCLKFRISYSLTYLRIVACCFVCIWYVYRLLHSFSQLTFFLALRDRFLYSCSPQNSQRVVCCRCCCWYFSGCLLSSYSSLSLASDVCKPVGNTFRYYANRALERSDSVIFFLSRFVFFSFLFFFLGALY